MYSIVVLLILFRLMVITKGLLFRNNYIILATNHSRREYIKRWQFRMLSSVTDESESIVVYNANIVKGKIRGACLTSGKDSNNIRLVAVSKTKPVEAIRALYDSGHRDFGENYFQELVDKAAQLPEDIRWHFIGHLQSSKASKLVRDVKNLAALETIDSEKLASKLENACVASERPTLDVFIQVDTSGEETKSGVLESELLPLAKFIREQCPHLRIKGLMTIGAPGDFSCFDRLVRCRQVLCGELSCAEETMELSMGMSGDYEEAIKRGATSVRVGSTIFGERIYPSK